MKKKYLVSALSLVLLAGCGSSGNSSDNSHSDKSAQKAIGSVDTTPAVNALATIEKTQPKVEPAKVEPAKVVPAKVEPAKVVPAKVEPAKVAPTTDTAAVTQCVLYKYQFKKTASTDTGSDADDGGDGTGGGNGDGTGGGNGNGDHSGFAPDPGANGDEYGNEPDGQEYYTQYVLEEDDASKPLDAPRLYVDGTEIEDWVNDDAFPEYWMQRAVIGSSECSEMFTKWGSTEKFVFFDKKSTAEGDYKTIRPYLADDKVAYDYKPFMDYTYWENSGLINIDFHRSLVDPDDATHSIIAPMYSIYKGLDSFDYMVQFRNTDGSNEDLLTLSNLGDDGTGLPEGAEWLKWDAVLSAITAKDTTFKLPLKQTIDKTDIQNDFSEIEAIGDQHFN